jgi:pilus assembly protein CpaF
MADRDELEILAGVLREDLIARAGDDDDVGVEARIRELVDERAGILTPAQRDELARRVAQRSFGLGPLEPLLADPEVDELMVCGTRPVWVERAGRLEQTTVAFADAWTRPSRCVTHGCPTARA